MDVTYTYVNTYLARQALRGGWNWNEVVDDDDDNSVARTPNKTVLLGAGGDIVNFCLNII